MKILTFLVAVLCTIRGAVGTFIHTDPRYGKPFLPRGKNNDALTPHKGSNRGGLQRDDAQPRHKAAHSEADVQRAKDTIARGKTVKMPEPENWRKSETPEEGDDGFKYDPKTKTSKVFLGDALEIPSRQLRCAKGMIHQKRDMLISQGHGPRKSKRKVIGNDVTPTLALNQLRAW